MADDTENPENPETEPAAPAEATAATPDQPAAEPSAAPAAVAPTPAAPAEPDTQSPAGSGTGEVLEPKERRARRRAAALAKRGPRRPATQEERDVERKRKAAQRRRYRQRAKAKRAERPRGETPEPAPKATGQQKVRQGIVMSDKTDKTITVRIDVARRHRRYQKTIRSSSTLHVHDERNEAHSGDTVRVVEARPLSRLKRWRLVEVLERAK